MPELFNKTFPIHSNLNPVSAYNERLEQITNLTNEIKVRTQIKKIHNLDDVYLCIEKTGENLTITVFDDLPPKFLNAASEVFSQLYKTLNPTPKEESETLIIPPEQYDHYLKEALPQIANCAEAKEEVKIWELFFGSIISPDKMPLNFPRLQFCWHVKALEHPIASTPIPSNCQLHDIIDVFKRCLATTKEALTYNKSINRHCIYWLNQKQRSILIEQIDHYPNSEQSQEASLTFSISQRSKHFHVTKKPTPLIELQEVLGFHSIVQTEDDPYILSSHANLLAEDKQILLGKCLDKISYFSQFTALLLEKSTVLLATGLTTRLSEKTSLASCIQGYFPKKEDAHPLKAPPPFKTIKAIEDNIRKLEYKASESTLAINNKALPELFDAPPAKLTIELINDQNCCGCDFLLVLERQNINIEDYSTTKHAFALFTDQKAHTIIAIYPQKHLTNSKVRKAHTLFQNWWLTKDVPARQMKVLLTISDPAIQYIKRSFFFPRIWVQHEKFPTISLNSLESTLYHFTSCISHDCLFQTAVEYNALKQEITKIEEIEEKINVSLTEANALLNSITAQLNNLPQQLRNNSQQKESSHPKTTYTNLAAAIEQLTKALKSLEESSTGKLLTLQAQLKEYQSIIEKITENSAERLFREAQDAHNTQLEPLTIEILSAQLEQLIELITDMLLKQPQTLTQIQEETKKKIKAFSDSLPAELQKTKQVEQKLSKELEVINRRSSTKHTQEKSQQLIEAIKKERYKIYVTEILINELPFQKVISEHLTLDERSYIKNLLTEGSEYRSLYTNQTKEFWSDNYLTYIRPEKVLCNIEDINRRLRFFLEWVPNAFPERSNKNGVRGVCELHPTSLKQPNLPSNFISLNDAYNSLIERGTPAILPFNKSDKQLNMGPAINLRSFCHLHILIKHTPLSTLALNDVKKISIQEDGTKAHKLMASGDLGKNALLQKIHNLIPQHEYDDEATRANQKEMITGLLSLIKAGENILIDSLLRKNFKDPVKQYKLGEYHLVAFKPLLGNGEFLPYFIQGNAVLQTIIKENRSAAASKNEDKGTTNSESEDSALTIDKVWKNLKLASQYRHKAAYGFLWAKLQYDECIERAREKLITPITSEIDGIAMFNHDAINEVLGFHIPKRKAVKLKKEAKEKIQKM